MHDLLTRIVNVERHEVAALVWSFAYFFCLLCGYYILRPVRDEMGIQAGVDQLQWLFTATFVTMLAVVPLFGWLTYKLPRSQKFLLGGCIERSAEGDGRLGEVEGAG